MDNGVIVSAVYFINVTAILTVSICRAALAMSESSDTMGNGTNVTLTPRSRRRIPEIQGVPSQAYQGERCLKFALISDVPCVRAQPLRGHISGQTLRLRQRVVLTHAAL